ncbi:MAG: DUF6795 domain-containing protein [Casimicrobium sp.]
MQITKYLLGARYRGALRALVVPLALSTVGCNEVNAMSEVVIFSAVRGVVTSQGKPVVGATLERETRWTWGKETVNDTATSGSDGAFNFPAIKRKMLAGALLPHEPNVFQKIVIQHGGKSYLAWSLNKRNYDDNGELLYFDDNKGMVPYRDIAKPISIQCRLESPEHRNGKVFGICDFD